LKILVKTDKVNKINHPGPLPSPFFLLFPVRLLSFSIFQSHNYNLSLRYISRQVGSSQTDYHLKLKWRQEANDKNLRADSGLKFISLWVGWSGSSRSSLALSRFSGACGLTNRKPSDTSITIPKRKAAVAITVHFFNLSCRPFFKRKKKRKRKCPTSFLSAKAFNFLKQRK